MVKNPPDGVPRITPYLLYEDVAAALDWLKQAFGMHERFRFAGPEGRVNHAEMELADGLVMMGWPGPDYRSSRSHGHTSQLVHVYVDDIDAHYERAKKAGAEILAELEDKFYGDRSYRTQDLEGQQWVFSQHVRDVPPEEMHP